MGEQPHSVRVETGGGELSDVIGLSHGLLLTLLAAAVIALFPVIERSGAKRG
jgi:hypothetical protein